MGALDWAGGCSGFVCLFGGKCSAGGGVVEWWDQLWGRGGVPVCRFDYSSDPEYLSQILRVEDERVSVGYVLCCDGGGCAGGGVGVRCAAFDSARAECEGDGGGDLVELYDVAE